MKKHELRYRVLLFTFIFFIIAVSPIPVDAIIVPYEDSFKQGPYVDKVLFKFVIENKPLALLNNEIDMHVDRIVPKEAMQLVQAEDVDVVGCQRNGYGAFTINCAKYPYNITAFRRAFAFVLDKRRICQECWLGYAQPQDSIIPYVNDFSIEGEPPYSYYDSNPEIGNQLLDNAGFLDVNADGWREAPDGSLIEILIDHATGTDSPAPQIAGIAAENLQKIGIKAEARIKLIHDITGAVDHHRDFDIVFLGYTFGGFGFMWLTNFRSSLANVDYKNEPSWSNESYDEWCNILLSSQSDEEIEEAIIQLQRIFMYECPRIPVYSNILYTGYRTDVFENHYTHPFKGIANRVTYRKVHRCLSAGGPWGGVFRVGIENINTLNHMKSGLTYEGHILSCLLEPLTEYDVNGIQQPGLAERWLTEFNCDNSEVPRGHTRLTFDIIQNATWSDGMPITAEDVAFSLNYYRDSVKYGNPNGIPLQDLIVAYAPRPFRVIAEFDTISIMHLETLSIYNILPKHVFKEIGLEGWDLWEPVIDESDVFVTSGPFAPGQYLAGEFLELVARPNWAYSIALPESTTTTETTINGGSEDYSLERISLIVLAGVVGAVVVIVPGRFLLGQSGRR